VGMDVWGSPNQERWEGPGIKPRYAFLVLKEESHKPSTFVIFSEGTSIMCLGHLIEKEKGERVGSVWKSIVP